MGAARSRTATEHFRIRWVHCRGLIAGTEKTKTNIFRAVAGRSFLQTEASFEEMKFCKEKFIFNDRATMPWNHHNVISRGFASHSKNNEEKQEVEEEAEGEEQGESEDEGQQYLSEKDESIPGLSDTESDPKDDPELNVANRAPLYAPALKCAFGDMEKALEAWLSEGNVITRKEAIDAFRSLRKRKLYRRGLKVSEWLVSKKPFEFDDICYSYHLDFLFKVRGLLKAEKYFEKIPPNMKGIAAHRTLLVNYSNRRLLWKTIKLFKQMQNAGLKIDIFDYNYLLMVHNRNGRYDVPEVLKAMESEGIEPNTLTYRLLLLMKSAKGDIGATEEIVNTMKSTGKKVNPDLLGLMGRQYINAGMTEKAKQVISELERFCDYSRRYIVRKAIFLHGLLKNKNDVKRLWEDLESLGKLSMRDYTIGVMSWGKVGDIEKAEEIFESMLTSGISVKTPHYNSLLNVYAEHGLLTEANDLVKRMTENGIEKDRRIIDTLVKLYLVCNEGDKTPSLLSDYFDKTTKLDFATKLRILRRFAERGDVKNAERIFEVTRKVGFSGNLLLYEILLQAYERASVPAYGFKERMLGDKTYPNQKIKEILEKLNARKKSSVET